MRPWTRSAPSGRGTEARREGRLRAPLTLALVVANVLVYALFQHGGATAGTPRGIEYRCNAVEYGLIPYEVTHPGERLTDPFCQPQEEPAGEAQAHEEPRSDPGLEADAPTWLTPLTAMAMHGGLVHLGGSMALLLLLGWRLEPRLGAPRLAALYLLGGLASSALLVALSPSLPIATIGSLGAVAALAPAAPALLPAGIILQLVYALRDLAQPVAGAGGDIAYLAPLGGLALGLLAVRYAARSGRSG
jgi:membrane associated rhomboid family serine protease